VTKRARVRLSPGSHRLAVTYFEAGGDGVVDFRWHADSALAPVLPALPVFPAPVESSRYRVDRALTYLAFLLTCTAALAGIVLLLGAFRALFPTLGALETAAVLVFVVLLAFNGAEVLRKRSTAVTGCDSYAYLQGAEVMARDGCLETHLEDPLVPAIVHGFQRRPNDDQLIFLLSPHGHYVHDLERGIVHNVFPPGLSWLLLPFVAAGGRDAAFLVLPLLNIAAAVLFFVIATRRLGVLFALPATAFTFFNFTVFEQTVILMSDLPSMVLLGASCYCLFLAWRSPRPVLVVAAGVLFGLALPIRYSNAAAGVPLLVLMLAGHSEARRWKEKAVDVASFSAAALLFGVLPLALYTHHLFSTPFRLVYEPITQSTMKLANVPAGLGFYADGLLRQFGAPGIVLLCVGLVAGLWRRQWRPAATVGIVAVLAFLAFYLPQSLREHRYLMPVYPFLAMLYAFSGMLIGGAFRRWKPVPVVLAVLLAAYPLARSHGRYFQASFSQEETCRQLAERVEPNAVVFADALTGPVRLYAGLTGYRFVWTRLEVLEETLAILHRLSRPVYFILDSETATKHFRLVTTRRGMPPEDFQPITTINGLPLYRHVVR